MLIDVDGRMDLMSAEPGELEAAAVRMGQPAYRGRQIFQALYRGVGSIEGITALPSGLRRRLAEEFMLPLPEIAALRESSDGTKKAAIRLYDQNIVEAVLMKYKHGASVCISTQAGCRMGCAFCASGLTGLGRGLYPSEMLGQIILMCRLERLRSANVVLMGTGEPLDNYENLMGFLRLVSNPDGLNIGARRISLSTSGLADGIDRLAEERTGVTLSVSLHAPFDRLRDRLMPINRAFPIGRLMESCVNYQNRTGRRISYEYALFDGVNDGDECAEGLIGLLRDKKGHINLIRANPVAETGLLPSGPGRVRRFMERLTEGGLNATLRRSLGADIEGACGQLRMKTGAVPTGG